MFRYVLFILVTIKNIFIKSPSIHFSFRGSQENFLEGLRDTLKAKNIHLYQLNQRSYQFKCCGKDLGKKFNFIKFSSNINLSKNKTIEIKVSSLAGQNMNFMAYGFLAIVLLDYFIHNKDGKTLLNFLFISAFITQTYYFSMVDPFRSKFKKFFKSVLDTSRVKHTVLTQKKNDQKNSA